MSSELRWSHLIISTWSYREVKILNSNFFKVNDKPKFFNYRLEVTKQQRIQKLAFHPQDIVTATDIKVKQDGVLNNSDL